MALDCSLSDFTDPVFVAAFKRYFADQRYYIMIKQLKKKIFPNV